MREFITSGRMGRVAWIHTWNFNRMEVPAAAADELKSRWGGGHVPPGSNQFDIIGCWAADWCGAPGQTFGLECPCRSSGAHRVMPLADGITANRGYNTATATSRPMEPISD